MTKTTQVIRLPTSATFPRLYDANKLIVGGIYLAGYVALDWISFIEPYAPFGITPWNPGTGLSFVLVLVFGPWMIPFLFAGPLLSDLIQIQPPLPLTVELTSVALIGGCYSAALLVLTRLRFDPALSSMKDLFLLMLTAVVSAAIVASGYVTVMISARLLPSQDFAAAALRYWVGDVIGIIVIAPFALIAFNRRRTLRMSPETVLQFVAIVAALWLVFGFAEEQKFQLFYVLFLPIVWMAVRTGSEGVSIGLLITQLGLILGVSLFPEKGHDVTALQALMLVLAATGLVAGELVTEHRRTTTQLHLHQDSLSHLARLGSMGELAAAVAHELNQPLMAAGTYARLVEDAIRSESGDAATVSATAQKAVAQIDRAAEVLRRLRALIRLDRSARVSCPVERIVKDTLALCRPDLDRIHASAKAALPADLPPVMVDVLQVEQALLNLLRNAIEAIANTAQCNITIEASVTDADFVEIAVRDSGPGFPPDRRDNPFLPFSSTKAEGLGFGLPLCKSIIEAHGGQLWLDSRAPGATVRFTLPIAKGPSYG